MVTVKNLSKKNLPLLELKEKLKVVAKEKKITKRVYLYLVDNEEIQRLNKEFLGKNKPTNVISFPYEKKDKLLGEIFISVPYCESEMEETNLNLEELIVFYFIHGLLHLLGYEHIYGGKEEEKMDKEQRRLFKIVYPQIELEE